MKLKLPGSVCSPQDLQSLIVEVRQFAKWFSHVSVKQKMSLEQTSAQPAISAGAAELINTYAAGKDLTVQILDDLIADLEDFRTNAPQLTITLAAPAHGELKRTLAAWCRDNIEDNILVSFQFNSTLLGGMVVRHGSRIFDWSFRRQLMAGRDKFPEVLRRV